MFANFCALYNNAENLHNEHLTGTTSDMTSKSNLLNIMVGQVVIPDGLGIGCSNCNVSIRLSETVDTHQKVDTRTEHIHQCKLKKGARFNWDVKHEDLIHRCDSFVPVDTGQPVCFRPLSSDAVHQRIEQMAQDPRCDYIASAALADRLFGKLKNRVKRINLQDARREIADLQKRSPLVGQIASGIFEDRVQIDKLQRGRFSR